MAVLKVSDVLKAAHAFQSEISESYWEEHGISDEEAARGMLAAMQALGFCDGVSAAKIVAVWKRWKRREDHRAVERERTRRAALTPQQRLIEDESRAAMRSLEHKIMGTVLDQRFQTNTFLTLLRGKAP